MKVTVTLRAPFSFDFRHFLFILLDDEVARQNLLRQKCRETVFLSCGKISRILCLCRSWLGTRGGKSSKRHVFRFFEIIFFFFSLSCSFDQIIVEDHFKQKFLNRALVYFYFFYHSTFQFRSSTSSEIKPPLLLKPNNPRIILTGSKSIESIRKSLFLIPVHQKEKTVPVS